MNAKPPRLDLRSGARVRWEPAHSGAWLQGKLVRPSTTNEEWLVTSDAGQRYWIDVKRLRPAS
ncbi:MAG: hypothetical protein HYU87_00075 [Chloroflexi bacterium]|nr:hypothetical protein [Chloroflexota bacterium]